ncbi:LysR family transcriptional regulator [Pseudovibrio ascidiaceicola]|uniref:LysR family transcriptional regulator n=1 Tax=Pseudovibrio ascidiaceicola TaxID=285279 RepID=UPI000D698445|nr:LysR family transcriptional regulator [Pseudovibrio ascidiaceicola]
MPSIDQLEAFVTAAELGSFSAAARRLGKAQSAVSAAISNLEIDLGSSLFDRSSYRAELTVSGVSLLDYARSILQSRQDLLVKAGALCEGAEGSLKVVFEYGTYVSEINDVFHDFDKQFPKVELHVQTSSFGDVLSRLAEESAQLGIIIERHPYKEGYHFRGLGFERRISVCHKDHPLAELDEVRLVDLRRYRQIISETEIDRNSPEFSRQKGPHLLITDNPRVAHNMVHGGVGWAELPAQMVDDEVKAGELKELSYDFQQNAILNKISLVWGKQQAQAPACKWLINRMCQLHQKTWV